MTWVKICGTTNLEDALMAIEAGADAIGFVFAPSRRQVTATEVARIVGQMPEHVEKIGIFLNESAERVVRVAEEAGLSGVQLHGAESLQSVRRLKESAPRLKIFKGIHVSPTLPADLHLWLESGVADAVLLDSGSPQKGGGTGKTFDWESAGHVISGAPKGSRLVVAGGLSPENVAHAITRMRPWGVDVVSGVEAEVGRKDPRKVRAFIDAARGVSA